MRLAMTLLVITIMVVFLTSCTKVDFEGYDPSTSLLKWVIQKEKKAVPYE